MVTVREEDLGDGKLVIDTITPTTLLCFSQDCPAANLSVAPMPLSATTPVAANIFSDVDCDHDAYLLS